MKRRIGWIRLLGLLCAGLCAAPVMAAQTDKQNHKGAPAGATVYRQPSAAAQRPAPAAQSPVRAATVAKAPQTNTQKTAAAAQSQPAAGALRPSTTVYTQPVTNVRPNVSPATATTPARTPTQTQPAQSPPPGMYTYRPSGGQAKVSPTAGPAGTSTTGTSTTGSAKTGMPGSNSPAAGEGNPSFSGGTSDGMTAGRYSPSGTTKAPSSSGGTSDGPAAGQSSSSTTAKGSSTSDGNPNGSRSAGSTLPPTAQTQTPPTDGYKPPVRVQPKGSPSPAPKSPRGPIYTQPSPAIPSDWPRRPRGYEPPPARGMFPSPVAPVSEPPAASPTPSVPPTSPGAQPSGNGGEPAPPNTPTPNAGSPAVPPTVPKPEGRTLRPEAGGGQGGGVGKVLPKTAAILPGALTLTTKTLRPVVDKDVAVVAALEPSHAGASYRLDWGDGSVETVNESGVGTHRYAKAKMYKVSASTVVGGSELNHEILLQVGPVGPFWPRYDWLLGALAGLAALFLHFPPVPKLTASPRWGAPGVPEMTLLSREPYLSLSFEPGVRPAEEDITFAKKRRKSGLEQG